LIPELEMRERLARIVEFDNPTPDPNDAHRRLIDKARRSFDPDPLSSEGIKEAVRKWASPRDVSKSETSLSAIHRIVEEHRAELQTLLPEYTASYIDYRKRRSRSGKATHMSPHFQDPRLVEREAPNNTMVNGVEGSGWRYFLLFGEANDPIHGPISRRIRQVQSARQTLIQQYFSHLKYGPDVSPWPPE
jgi:hypothetical protein